MNKHARFAVAVRIQRTHQRAWPLRDLAKLACWRFALRLLALCDRILKSGNARPQAVHFLWWCTDQLVFCAAKLDRR